MLQTCCRATGSSGVSGDGGEDVAAYVWTRLVIVLRLARAALDRITVKVLQVQFFDVDVVFLG